MSEIDAMKMRLSERQAQRRAEAREREARELREFDASIRIVAAQKQRKADIKRAADVVTVAFIGSIAAILGNVGAIHRGFSVMFTLTCFANAAFRAVRM